MRCKNRNRRQKNHVDQLLRFLTAKVKSIGIKVAYSALLLFYAHSKKETPAYAKHIILGSIAYLLSPIDAIPDLTPLLGFTDDLGILSYALVTIACYINEDVRKEAKERLNTIFKKVDEEMLLEIDAVL